MAQARKPLQDTKPNQPNPERYGSGALSRGIGALEQHHRESQTVPERKNDSSTSKPRS